MFKKFMVIGLIFSILLPSSSFAMLLLKNGRKVVASAATAEALSASEYKFDSATICAETDNTGNITVGDSTVIAALATRQGIPLNAGDCYSIPSYGDLAKIYIDSTVNGDGVTYTTYRN
jgi:hypothetical protein